MARLLLLSLSFLLATGFGGAQRLHDERIWTGKNGKRIRAAFLRIDPDTGHYQLHDGRKSYRIDPANLSAADRTWVQEHLDKSKPDRPPGSKGGPDGAFRNVPPLRRNTVPVIDQADFGSKASDCVPSSFCNFLIWWDQEELLAIPKGGDREKRAEWVHDRVALYMRTRNNTGTYADRAKAGINKYFRNHLADLATVRIVETHDCSPANLAKFATGPNATMLNLSVYHDDRRESGHWVALSQADPSGILEIITWGRRFQCKLKAIKDANPKGAHNLPSRTNNTYELVIQNQLDRTDYMKNNDVRFVIDPEQWDSLIVAKPYLYAIKGRPAPPPADPSMEDQPRGALATLKPRAIPPPAALVFSNPARPLPIRTNAPEAWNLLARSLDGPAGPVAHGIVDYEYLGPPRTKFKRSYRIEFSGSRFRVTDRQHSIVADLASGAFISTGRQRRIGRFQTENLYLPPYRDADPNRALLLQALRESEVNRSSPWPARACTTRLNDRQPSGRHPVISFAPVKVLPIHSAWRLISGAWVKDEASGGSIILASDYSLMIAAHDGIFDVLGTLRIVDALPVQIDWKTGMIPRISQPEQRKRIVGNYSLRLTGFTLEEPPADRLAIPAEAFKMKLGWSKTF